MPGTHQKTHFALLFVHKKCRQNTTATDVAKAKAQQKLTKVREVCDMLFSFFQIQN